MNNLLDDMEYELTNIKNLFLTLNNAMQYCHDIDAATNHLQTLSNYTYKRFDKFVNNFQKMEVKYIQKHSKSPVVNDFHDTNT